MAGFSQSLLSGGARIKPSEFGTQHEIEAESISGAIVLARICGCAIKTVGHRYKGKSGRRTRGTAAVQNLAVLVIFEIRGTAFGLRLPPLDLLIVSSYGQVQTALTAEPGTI